jgi:hypothetical protein
MERIAVTRCSINASITLQRRVEWTLYVQLVIVLVTVCRLFSITLI